MDNGIHYGNNIYEMGEDGGKRGLVRGQKYRYSTAIFNFYFFVFSKRKCSEKTRWSCEHIHHLFYWAFSSNASIHSTYPKASEHPGSQPLHCDWPYPHGDCRGYLPQAGTAAVPGDTQWVRALLWRHIGLWEKDCRGIKKNLILTNISSTYRPFWSSEMTNVFLLSS